MHKETIVDNEWGTIWYYPDQKIIAHQVKKFLYGQAYRDFLLTGTELMLQKKAEKWLSDDRNSPVLRREDMEWGVVNWFPQTKAAGWKYWAMVKPVQAIGEMSMQRVVDDATRSGVVTKLFSDFDEAFKWLESQGEEE